jgi:hypothetical protein
VTKLGDAENNDNPETIKEDLTRYQFTYLVMAIREHEETYYSSDEKIDHEKHDQSIEVEVKDLLSKYACGTEDETPDGIPYEEAFALLSPGHEKKLLKLEARCTIDNVTHIDLKDQHFTAKVNNTHLFFVC